MSDIKLSLIAFVFSMVLFGGLGLVYRLILLACKGHRRDGFYRLVAEALPSPLAYWVGVRIWSHALRTRYLDLPARSIGAHEALEHWRGEAERDAPMQPETIDVPDVPRLP